MRLRASLTVSIQHPEPQRSILIIILKYTDNDTFIHSQCELQRSERQIKRWKYCDRMKHLNNNLTITLGKY